MRLHLHEVVRQREQAKTIGPQSVESAWNLRVGRHLREGLRELLLVGGRDLDAPGLRQHVHDGCADVGEGHVVIGLAGQCWKPIHTCAGITGGKGCDFFPRTDLAVWLDYCAATDASAGTFALRITWRTSNPSNCGCPR